MRGLVLLLALIPTLAHAEPVQWRGTLEVGNLTGLPVVLTGTGLATLNGGDGGVALSSLRLAGGTFEGASIAPVTDPEITAGAGIVGFIVQPELGTGTLAGFDRFALPWEPKLTRNALAMRGVQGLCLFDLACLPGGFIGMPLSQPGKDAAIGVGGLLTVGGAGVERVSILAHPWTVQPIEGSTLVATPDGGLTPVPFTLAPEGWPNPVVGPEGNTWSGAVPGGSVAMVTYSSLGPGNSGAAWRTAMRMKIRFVPEPGIGLLLAAGIIGLLILPRTKDRGFDHD